MNEKFEELYSYLSNEGLTTLEKDAFYSKYSDPSKSKSIYDYLSSEGMTDLDHNAFHQSYFTEVGMSTPVAAATEAANEYKESLKKKDVSESPSGDGSSVLQSPDSLSERMGAVKDPSEYIKKEPTRKEYWASKVDDKVVEGVKTKAEAQAEIISDNQFSEATRLGVDPTALDLSNEEIDKELGFDWSFTHPDKPEDKFDRSDYIAVAIENPLDPDTGFDAIGGEGFEERIPKFFAERTSELKNYKSDTDKLRETASTKEQLAEVARRDYVLTRKISQLESLQGDYKKALGAYYENREGKGNVAGLVTKQFAKGFTNMSKSLMHTGADLLPYLAPEAYNITAEDVKEAEEKNISVADLMAKKTQRMIYSDIEKGMEDWISMGTTDEYINSEDRNDIVKAISFMAESVGSGMSGGGSSKLAQVAFFSQSYNAMEREMSGEAFDEMTQFEKKLVSVPYGIAIGKLEKLGFTKATGQKTLLDKYALGIATKAMDALPKNASIKAIDEAIGRVARTEVAKIAGKVAGAGVQEGLTEGLQSLFESGQKNVMNAMIGKDMFDVPDITTGEGVKEIFENAATEAYYGALGGMIMAGPATSVKAVKEGYSNRKSDREFDIFYESVMNDGFRSSAIMDLQSKVRSGEITAEEALEQRDALNEAYKTMSSMPEELTTRQKRESFNLITERNKLEKEIEGKDKALVDDKLQRIKDINEELKIISKTEAATEEIVPEVSDVEATGVSEESKKVTAEEYSNILTGIKESDPEMYWSVDNVSKEDAEAGTIVGDENGYGVVSPDGDVKGVFKVPGSTEKNVADNILQEAVKAGGKKLDNFDNYLTKIYNRNGFRVVSRLPFNEEYAPEGWNKEKHGTPDVVAMVYDPDGKLDIEEKTFTDYDEAMNYRDSYIESTPNQVTKESISELISNTDEGSVETLKAAERVSGALDKSGVKIFAHKTTDEYNSAIAKSVGTSKESIDSETQKSRGEYITGKKEIHINLENADSKTVFHEAFHAVLETAGFTNDQITELTEAIKTGTKDEALISKADELAQMYEEGEVNEEFASEFVGLLSSQEVLASPTLMQKIMAAIGRMLGLDTTYTKKQDYIDFVNDVSAKLRRGEDITTTGISTTIQKPTRKAQLVEHTGKHDLSYVSKDDIIDIDSLIDDIIAKDQKVWFWVADQLGRGMYYDNVLDNEHYLDAGPSYPLDPKNRKDNKIWATGISKKAAEKAVANNDYIFIISGSPEKSKLFNKQVAGITKQRIENKVKYSTFKKNMMKVGTKKIKDIVSKYDSYEDLFNSTDRKPMLLEILDQSKKPNSKAHKLLKKYDAFVDPDQLRDGFYKDNGFEQNDVMIVLKPTEVGGKSEHSTYEFDIIGEVVGVPNKRINAYELMPEEVKAKYDESMARAMQQQVVAPYGVGTEKKIERKKQIVGENAQLKEKVKRNLSVARQMEIDGENPKTIYLATGWERGVDNKWRYNLDVNIDEWIELIADSIDTDVLNKLDLDDKGRHLPSQKVQTVNLKDVLPDYVLEAYEGREEIDIQVTFDPDTNQNYYDYDEKKIVVSAKDPVRVGMMAYTLAHETQHVVQEIEGFSEGATSGMLTDKAKSIRPKYDALEKSIKQETGYDSIKSLQGDLLDEMQKSDFNNTNTAINWEGSRKSLLKEFLVDENYSGDILSEKPRRELLEYMSMERAANQTIGYSKYIRHAGEVEARNVEDRLAMTSEERASTPISETEDVAREDQILLFEMPSRKKQISGDGKKKGKTSTQKKIDKTTGVSKTRQKVEVGEVAALKDQIRLEAKSAREAAKSEKDVRKKIARTLKDMMEKAPRIFKEKQITAITQRALKMNLSNPVMEQRFIEYVDKVYNDAEYAAKEQEATIMQRKIKRLTRKKGNKQNTNYTVGKAFGRINPRLVEDIDEYMAVANEVINALGKSRLFGADVIFRNMPNLGDISTYIENEIARQEEIEKNTLLELFPELVEAGVINDNQSLSQIREILKAIQQKDDVGLTEKQQQDIIDAVSERFADVQDITRQMVESGVDPFTGEPIVLSKVEKNALKNMLDVDLGDLSVKQALELVDVMTNFITNGVTDNIDSITAVIEGNKNAKIAEGMLKPEYKDKNWKITRAYDAMFATLPLFLEKITGSPTMAGRLADLMGINEYREGVVRATREVAKVKNEYSDRFEKTKPNGLHFRSAENVYERGMYAFLTRNISGTKEEQITEFNRRVKLMRDSIAFLTSNSKRVTDDMRRKGEMYQKVAENMGLFDEGLTILDIESRVNKTNKEAVNFWIDKWMDSYSEVSDVAKTVYNKELGQDQNYIPDTYRKVDQIGEFDPDNMELARFDDVVGQEAGSLKDIVRPENLPKTSTGAIDRYVDLSFDMNNAGAYEAALTDVYTARAARKIKGFLNSKEFNEMFTAENQAILKGKIISFAQSARGKDRQRELEEQTIRKVANSISKIAVSLGLGGVFQIVKQTAPVMVATAMQTRRGSTGVLDYWKDRDAVNTWLSENNADVSIRGLESETVAKMSDRQRLKVEKKLEKLKDKPDKMVEFYLKMFLQKGDVGIAKASFIAHYKTALERLGKPTDIDFSKPMDPDAKAYAQQMLDRHQNVSIGGLQGQAFTNSNVWADVGRKVLMPFANFVINAKVRTAADIKTLTSQGVDSKDKWNAARSIGGTVMEIAVYRAMASAINGGIQSLAYSFAGYDPEDDDPEINKEVEKENNRRIKDPNLEPMTDTEDREFRQKLLSDRWWENFYKTSVTQAVTDLFSPMPPFDAAVLEGANAMIKPLTEPSKSDIAQAVLEENERRADLRMKAMTKEERDKFKDDYKDKHTFQLWGNTFGEGGYGMYSIPTDKSAETYKYAFAATEGVIETESNMGKSKRYLSDRDKEIAKIGTFAKLLYMSRIAPTEVGYAADKLMKAVEKSSMTPKQNTEYRDAISFLNTIGADELTQEEENMIKAGSSGFESIVESRMATGVDIDIIKRMVVINEISDVSGLPKSEVIERIGKKDIDGSVMDLFKDEIEDFNKRSATFNAAKKKYEISEIEELKKVVR